MPTRAAMAVCAEICHQTVIAMHGSKAAITSVNSTSSGCGASSTRNRVNPTTTLANATSSGTWRWPRTRMWWSDSRPRRTPMRMNRNGNRLPSSAATVAHTMPCPIVAAVPAVPAV